MNESDIGKVAGSGQDQVKIRCRSGQIVMSYREFVVENMRTMYKAEEKNVDESMGNGNGE